MPGFLVLVRASLIELYLLWAVRPPPLTHCRESAESRLTERSTDRKLTQYVRNSFPLKRSGGGSGIRTLEGVTPLLVFKTSALNRSANPPFLCRAADLIG